MVVVSLSLIGGLAAACFTKACGIIFLGTARSNEAAIAAEAPVGMRLPMILLAALCVVIGLAAPLMVRLVFPAAAELLPAAMNRGVPPFIESLMLRLCLATLVLIGLTALILFVKSRVTAHRPMDFSVTWDCGYAAPTARMQYSASSYIQPLMTMFRLVLHTKYHVEAPTGYFPAQASLETRTLDVFLHGIYAPALKALSKVGIGFRRLILGGTHLYILYIVITLLVLLIWNLR